uniref:Uncharacterized protein n=1 Tax=Toxoplasma gondii TgCATBr9 TaxID=943120 RepID=A0A2T6IPG4_TOXGO|nr:hypothetical protein TGBR9_383120 [Toxoplasma gondii TgCATBr9]
MCQNIPRYRSRPSAQLPKTTRMGRKAHMKEVKENPKTHTTPLNKLDLVNWKARLDSLRSLLNRRRLLAALLMGVILRVT